MKREILLLGYYTPEELKTQTETIYTPASNGNNVIKLKFNLADEGRTSPIREEKREGDIIEIPGDKIPVKSPYCHLSYPYIRNLYR